MIKRRRFPRIFFGWWTVLGGGMLALWGFGYNVYGFGALFKPIAKELGFSRAATSVASSIGRFEGGIEAPLTGWITDKFGPRWIVRAGVFLIGVSLILMYFINSLWAFYLVWGVMLGTGVNIALGLPLDAAITNWFVKKRGLALSIKLMFQGLAGVLVLPLIAWLIVTQGWRMAVFVGGVVMLVVGIPLAWFCIKQHRPEFYGLLPDGATVEEEAAATSQMIDRGVKYAAEVGEVEFTLRQAMRTPGYWLLTLSTGIAGMVFPIISIHGIPLLTDMGIDPLRAAVVLGTIFAISIPTRFIAGFIADRVKKGYLRFMMGGVYLLQAVGLAIFVLNPTIAMIYVMLILYFSAHGITVPLGSLMRGRYFGRKAFGSIQGSTQMLVTPIGVLAPIYAGWIYDTTGSYLTAFKLFAVLLAVSTVIMAFAAPPKPPAQITDIRKIV